MDTLRAHQNRGSDAPHETDNTSRVRREASATWEERERRNFWGGASYRSTYSRHSYVRYCAEEEAV